MKFKVNKRKLKKEIKLIQEHISTCPKHDKFSFGVVSTDRAVNLIALGKQIAEKNFDKKKYKKTGTFQMEIVDLAEACADFSNNKIEAIFLFNASKQYLHQLAREIDLKKFEEIFK